MVSHVGCLPPDQRRNRSQVNQLGEQFDHRLSDHCSRRQQPKLSRRSGRVRICRTWPGRRRRDYSQSVIESHHADQDEGDVSHVPCCSHPLSIQLLIFRATPAPEHFVSSGSAAMPLLVQSYRSCSQSPPETGRRFVAVASAQESHALAQRRAAQAKQTLDLISDRSPPS